MATFEERFLAELTRQCDGKDVAILNKVLRAQLGWMDERFDKVRQSLIKKKIVKPGQGQGGKTSFVNFQAAIPKKKTLRAFISYCHADDDLKKEFLKHLKPLERLGLITSWNDRHIKPGDDFGVVIDEKLNEADLIFLLVSIDFINSKYCYEIEMERALERHKEKTARIIPIILRDCLWNNSPFGGIQALPQDAEPVASQLDKNRAFTKIAHAVHELAQELLAAPLKDG